MSAKDRLNGRVCAAALAAISLIASLGGCVVPQSRYTAMETQNRALVEQNRAQLAEIENLNVHARNTADRLRRAEEELALFEEQSGLERRELADYRRQHEEMRRQFSGMAEGRGFVSPETNGRLAEISQRHRGLLLDPAGGVAKLKTDVLFDSGSAELKPGAERVLSELAAVLQQPEARDMKLMVVGHTDDRLMAKRPAREKFPDNFALSTARAASVAKVLSRYGVDSSRIGIAGFGDHQPVASNDDPADRRKNRRVELFVLSPNVPIVGWTETTPNIY